jgi:cation diffusion facilitator CzcD-associated flavoprotein CzcO
MERFDVIVVGAGFAGMYMLHRTRQLGLSVRVFEAADGVGGTWYWNRYPGARCDVESMEYSYGFAEELQQEWEWTERYATQPEILRYANHVADRFDLRRDIQFETRVTSAHFDDAATEWVITTDGGETVRSTYFVTALGMLSAVNRPDLPGLDTFAGPTYHTGHWPHEGVDFTGRRVAVIGTGSSGIQSIPLIAKEASELFVFQRTASYSIPAHNQQLAPEFIDEIKASYPEFRAANRQMVPGFGSRIPHPELSVLEVTPEERERIFEERWSYGGLPFLSSFNDLLLTPEANEHAAEFVRNKIRSIVHDPATAELLCPTTRIGCKRLCVDTGYYATFNEPHVTLVDIGSDPIERVTETGLVVAGTEYTVDDIVFATGFDAMTGSLLKIDIRGRNGERLADAWEHGPLTYLGYGVAGFPNMFVITGPLSPAALTNVFVSLEHDVEVIAECIEYLRDNGYATIEATETAQQEWSEFVNLVASFTVYPQCNSWYLGANIPDKPRVFMTMIGFPTYVERVNDVIAKGYDGFTLTRA